MNQTSVRNYIEKYLEIHSCNFIEKGPGHIEVKLSVDVDKDLTNRPYYWAFVERTGAESETLTMTFIFDPDKIPQGIRGEEIRFGSERLKQFFYSAKRRGKMVRLYQNSSHNELGTLTPWLGVNFKVEFLSDKKKDRLISLGINLSTGEMKEQFFQLLKASNLSPVLPPNVSTKPPFITFREAALQLEEWVLHVINSEDFNWAITANERLQLEFKQIEAYYDGHEFDAEERNEVEKKEQEEEIKQRLVEKEKKVEEVKWQYSPRVEVKPINYGVFYLDEVVQKNIEYLH